MIDAAKMIDFQFIASSSVSTSFVDIRQAVLHMVTLRRRGEIRLYQIESFFKCTCDIAFRPHHFTREDIFHISYAYLAKQIIAFTLIVPSLKTLMMQIRRRNQRKSQIQFPKDICNWYFKLMLGYPAVDSIR